jgi:hypothetical protein
MDAPAQLQNEKALNGALLAALFIAGVALLREGSHFDNVIDGWPFFASAFFSGMFIGFVGWTLAFGVTPQLKFSGSYRHPWLAALILGIASTSAASYLNRTFASPTERSMAAEIHSIEEGKGNRWHLTVKTPDGRYQRYLISQDVASALQNEKMVRLSVAHGALGFDYIARFEPFRQ